MRLQHRMLRHRFTLCAVLVCACSGNTASDGSGDTSLSDAGDTENFSDVSTASDSDGSQCIPSTCTDRAAPCGIIANGCGATISCGPCTVVFGSPVRVNDGSAGSNQREPSVGVDHQGQIWVAYMEDFTATPPAGKQPRDGFRTRYAVSSDGGATFSASNLISGLPMPYDGDPVISADPQDRVYITILSGYDQFCGGRPD